MGSIPKVDKDVLRIYKCAACDGHFMRQVGPIRASCSVAHSPGDCCHYAERRVTDETLNAVFRELSADRSPS